MGSIEKLLANYKSHVSLPWAERVAAPQRAWFAVYDPGDERRLRARIGEFEEATRATKHGWLHIDITNSFPTWMSEHEYRESYFEDPEYIGPALDGYAHAVAEQVRAVLSQPEADPNCVVAVSGVASLFGLASVSGLVENVVTNVRGRLLLFFPGSVEDGRYRLLDARDGWNYLAVPITG